jgi:hypothetical protein
MSDIDYHDIFNWHPGDCPEADGPIKYAGWAVVRALHGLHGYTAELAANKFVTAEGAAGMLAPMQEKVIAEAARQRRVAAAAAAELKASEDRLFLPPALDPGDVAGTSRDERRQVWFEGLNSNQRDEFEAQVRAGEHPGYAESLARSPNPGRARAFGLDCYRTEVETKKGDRVRALEARRRSLAWLDGVLNVAPRVAQSNPWSDKPVESPIERMTRARRSMKPTITA